MYNYPLLMPKQTSARIDFLRQGERLVDKKGTYNVKILAEKITKTDVLTSLLVTDLKELRVCHAKTDRLEKRTNSTTHELNNSQTYELTNSRPYKLTPSQDTCGGLPISEMFTNTPTTTNIINLWDNTHCGY